MPIFTQFDRFTRLGFNGNPFQTLSNATWGAVAVIPDAVLNALEATAHLQLLGAMGRGKTTTLLGIQHHLQAQGRATTYEYLPEHHHRYHTRHFPAYFLLDEAQRLWWGERLRLLRTLGRQSSTRLIFSSHVDLGRWFGWRGVPLQTVYIDDLPMSTLAEILARRLAYFRLVEGVYFTEEAVAWLADHFGSDRRGMERFLYEVFQALTEPQPITAALLADLWRA